MALKYELIRTPLERPLQWGRSRAGSLKIRVGHPELSWMYDEPAAISRTIKLTLKPDSNAIDVGCHYGSVLASFMRYAPQGRHIGFEASETKIPFLRRKFPDAEIHCAAVTDRVGDIAFYVDANESGFSTTISEIKPGAAAVMVAATTLDATVTDRTIDLVKIDVEGGELEVLLGAQQLIARDRPLLLLEIGPGSWPREHGNPTQTAAYVIDTLGYRLYSVIDYVRGDKPSSVDDVAAALHYPFRAFNWVGVPQ